MRGVAPTSANRLSCMCDDCQVYARYLGRADDILDAHGGTDMSYTTQARYSIVTGSEHLRCVRLSAGGLLRWYVGCCNTPIAHVPSPKIAFVGVPHLFICHEGALQSRDEILGPLVHRTQGRFGRGELPQGASLGTPVALRIKGITRVLVDTLRGRNWPSPFHDAASGRPVVAPTVLTAAELEALRGRLGKDEAPVLKTGYSMGGCT